MDRSRTHGNSHNNSYGCVADEQRTVINLGTQIKSVNATDNGFTMSYTDGDFCQMRNGEVILYSSQINFLCDKVDGDGFPVFVSEEDCVFTFSWRT